MWCNGDWCCGGQDLTLRQVATLASQMRSVISGLLSDTCHTSWRCPRSSKYSSSDFCDADAHKCERCCTDIRRAVPIYDMTKGDHRPDAMRIHVPHRGTRNFHCQGLKGGVGMGRPLPCMQGHGATSVHAGGKGARSINEGA